MRLIHCRSCGAEVVFVPSFRTGKRVILDAKPENRVLVTFDSGGGYVVGKIGEYGSVEGYAVVGPVYTDHHATCPKAKDWQGRTRKDPPA